MNRPTASGQLDFFLSWQRFILSTVSRRGKQHGTRFQSQDRRTDTIFLPSVIHYSTFDANSSSGLTMRGEKPCS
jgi:hypothetical protein